MEKIEITNKGNKLVVDSRLIAQALGIQHKNLLETIQKHHDEAVDEGFSVLAFETEKPLKGSQGGRPEVFTWLDEEWANYAMTLSRNTPEVRVAKRSLVKAFTKAKGLLSERSQLPQSTGQVIDASDAINLLDDLKHSLGVLSEQLEAGHALLKAGNGMVRSLHNAIHNQGGSLNQAEKFLKKAQAQIGQMEEALSSFNEGALLIEQTQTTTTRVILQRPIETRRRIEEFLDYLDTLSPEAYEAEFLSVPGLTVKERTYGKFSGRTIARRLGLLEGQERTINNIMRERRMS